MNRDLGIDPWNDLCIQVEEIPRKNTTKNTTNAMPKKNTSSVANMPRSAAEEEDTHVCPICAEPIVDEGEDGCAEDALFL